MRRKGHAQFTAFTTEENPSHLDETEVGTQTLSTQGCSPHPLEAFQLFSRELGPLAVAKNTRPYQGLGGMCFLSGLRTQEPQRGEGAQA